MFQKKVMKLITKRSVLIWKDYYQHLLTHGAETFWRSRQFCSILSNPKVHYCVHKSHPLVPILSQFYPIHTIPSYLSKIIISTLSINMKRFIIIIEPCQFDHLLPRDLK
jgi:hypothetical protein